MATLNEIFMNIANAIRSKTGGANTMTPMQMATEIENIPSASGDMITIVNNTEYDILCCGASIPALGSAEITIPSASDLVAGHIVTFFTEALDESRRLAVFVDGTSCCKVPIAPYTMQICINNVPQRLLTGYTTNLMLMDDQSMTYCYPTNGSTITFTLT